VPRSRAHVSALLLVDASGKCSNAHAHKANKKKAEKLFDDDRIVFVLLPLSLSLSLSDCALRRRRLKNLSGQEEIAHAK